MAALVCECHALAAREAGGADVMKMSREDWKDHFDAVELGPEALWLLDEYGLFSSINAGCGTYIEIGYEEAELRVDRLPMFMECIESSRLKAAAAGETETGVWDSLDQLAKGARARGVSVWIMF